ncbi:MAG: hypothetical protein WKF94_07860 [Solirubrobacteraceae bacterium]
MGKRSRKRPTGPVRVSEVTETSRPRRSTVGKSRVDRFIERAEERPKPPWHPVPLVELSVLAGIVLLVVGIINREDPQGRLAILFGLALAALAGLETAAREHFTGFRSHSSLLAAMPTVLTAILMGFIGVNLPIVLPAAVLVFAISFFAFRASFKRRTGVNFKV